MKTCSVGYPIIKLIPISKNSAGEGIDTVFALSNNPLLTSIAELKTSSTWNLRPKSKALLRKFCTYWGFVELTVQVNNITTYCRCKGLRTTLIINIFLTKQFHCQNESSFTNKSQTSLASGTGTFVSVGSGLEIRNKFIILQIYYARANILLYKLNIFRSLIVAPWIVMEATPLSD